MAWFLVIGLLHAGYRHGSPGGRWRVPGVIALIVLAGLAQVMLSTWSFSLIYPPSRTFWGDVLHLIDKRWLQGIFYALVLWGFFSLLWPLRAGKDATHLAAPPDATGRLRVSDGQTVQWLEPGEIRSLQSARNYVCLCLADRQIVVREPLNSLAERLPRDRFVRIGRSCLVQRDRILRIEPYSRHSKQVVLDNGAALRIGRTYLAAAEAALGIR
jgi:DNA-binding LytR/AlgR family response regulator